MTAGHEALAEIRSAELAAAKTISRATEAAREAVAGARAFAEQTVEGARTEGRAEADDRYRRTIQQAHAEASEIAATIDADVDRLRSSVGPRLDGLAADMLEALMPGGSR